MLVRKVAQAKGIQAKGLRPKITLKLPGALSLAASGRDGKRGIPWKKLRIVIGLSKAGKEIKVGKGKRQTTTIREGSEKAHKARSGSSGRAFSQQSSKRSRSSSNRPRLFREGSGHSSPDISSSSQIQIVLPHASAL